MEASEKVARNAPFAAAVRRGRGDAVRRSASVRRIVPIAAQAR